MVKEQLRLLVVEDSAFIRSKLKDLLKEHTKIEFYETSNSTDALEKIRYLRPNVIILDAHLPKVSSLETTRIIMSKFPTPIIVLFSMPPKDKKMIFDFIYAGALEYIVFSWELNKFKQELLEKILLATKVRVITHLSHRTQLRKESSKQLPPLSAPVREKEASRKKKLTVVGVAVSTGGPSALAKILSDLPREFPLTFLIAQHIAEGFTENLACWLNSFSKLKVRVAKSGDLLSQGEVYLAPTGYNLLVEKGDRLYLTKYPEDVLYRPSGDVLLSSVAQVYRGCSIGLILTGMGRDGVKGIKLIKEVGGITIAQNEEGCAVFGMPKEAIDEKCIDLVVPLSEMSKTLIEIGQRRIEEDDE